MRTFNGFQIFTQQLTNSGQLDARYVRITGNEVPANLFFGNLMQSADVHVNTNFNINKTLNIFINNDGGHYTGYMPNITDGRLVTIKNHSTSLNPLVISGYSENQRFEYSDEVIEINQKHGASFVGVINNNYTGWVTLSSNQGVT